MQMMQHGCLGNRAELVSRLLQVLALADLLQAMPSA